MKNIKLLLKSFILSALILVSFAAAAEVKGRTKTTVGLHKGTNTITIKSSQDVGWFEDVVVEKGETLSDVCVFGGSATISGKVEQVVIVIGGDLVLNEGAEIGDISVVYFGNIIMGKDSVIGDDAACFGGKIIKDPTAKIKGKTHDWGGSLSCPKLKLNYNFWKLLVVSFLFNLFLVLIPGVLIALVFTNYIEEQVEKLRVNILKAFAIGALTCILLPILLILLLITIIGIPLALLLPVVVMLCGFIGMISAAGLMGRRIREHFKAEKKSLLLDALIGLGILTVIFAIPYYIGFLCTIFYFCTGLGNFLLGFHQKHIVKADRVGPIVAEQVISEKITASQSVTGFVCGILSWMPLVGIILGVLGIIFSAIGMSKINAMPEKLKGLGLSIAGLVCSIVFGGGQFVILLLIIIHYL